MAPIFVDVVPALTENGTQHSSHVKSRFKALPGFSAEFAPILVYHSNLEEVSTLLGPQKIMSPCCLITYSSATSQCSALDGHKLIIC